MGLREQSVEALSGNSLDVLIVGGGINGSVCAAALTARGARVGLVDARDFAGFTSQHSSNLIWGGVKYMESYQFSLVAELCRSRNELMRRFPSAIREIRFLTTIPRGFRHHPVMMWAGSWLYWLIGRGHTRPPRYLRAGTIGTVEPVIDTNHSTGGLEYSDAYLFDNDARFVFGFIRSALDQGCLAANYVEAVEMQSTGEGWRVMARDAVSGRSLEIRCKVLVNAAGAYVDSLNAAAGIDSGYRHVLSKGVHLVVPRIGDSGKVLAFFADDGRLFFAIPMANRTCIGTTDTRVDSPDTTVTDRDRDFILSNINARLNLPRPLSRSDIIAERCGVRPLVVPRGGDATMDFLQLSRRHVVETDREDRQISIFGGKLTDCVNVGEEVCRQVAGLGVPLARRPSHWCVEPGKGERAAFLERAREAGFADDRAPDTGESLAERLWRRYGRDAGAMLEAVAKDPALAASAIAGTGLRRCEIDHLRDREMIVTLADLLRRRSKLALLYRHEDLMAMEGMPELCDRLFGSQGKTKFEDYFGDMAAV